MWAMPSLEPISETTSRAGSSDTPNRFRYQSAAAWRNAGKPFVVGVAMVRGIRRRFPQLRDDVRRCRQIRIADAEADDVDTPGSQGVLLLVDLSEEVGRKFLNSLGFLNFQGDDPGAMRVART